nr:IclR family transcriptional regulator [Actinoalloteichus hymeniacidonis]
MSTAQKIEQSGTLERGLAVLEHIGAAQEISTNAVAAQLGLSRSAAYRIVNTLKELGYLEADHITGRVRLGTRLVQLGVQAMDAADLHRSAPQFMAPLAEESAETVYLAVPEDDSMVYLAKEQGVRAVTLNCRLGGRRAQHVTSLGKAWLAALPPAERVQRVARMDLVRLTPNTIVDPDRLLEELAQTARRGWAIDDIENEPEVGCVAAAVRDRTGRPVAALSIAGPADRVLPLVERLGRAVAAAAAGLSRRLGYVPAGS